MSSELADAVFEAIEQVTEPLLARIKGLEDELAAVKAQPPVAGPMGPPGPQGEKGADGKDGRDGVDGQDGKDGRDGVDGLKGADGLPGADGKDGRDGSDGKDGRDGVGVADAVIDRDGTLVLTRSDGTTKALGVVVGAKGEPGRDGADGLGFEDLQIEQLDERTFTFKAARGEQVKSLGTFTIPALIYRGVWQAGRTYQPGEAATWGGSLWIAKEETSAKPDEHSASRAWQLAVKRGAPGPKGDAGDRGPQGLKGDKGDRGPERW